MPEFNKKHMGKSNVGKGYSVAGGYTLVGLWVLFTFILISWVVLASFSTSQEIFSDHMFKFVSGFHFDNYVKAWTTQRVSVFFMNSLLYTLASCTAIVVISAPAAYALSRFKFKGNALLQNMFAAGLGIPLIMVIMPLFGLVSQLHLTNNRSVLSFRLFQEFEPLVRRGCGYRRLQSDSGVLDYHLSACPAGHRYGEYF